MKKGRGVEYQERGEGRRVELGSTGRILPGNVCVCVCVRERLYLGVHMLDDLSDYQK